MIKILTLITARRNSKGLSNKHLLNLGSVKLIEHTFNFANKFDELGTIVLSTDCEDIIKASKKYKKIITPFKRPDNIALDTTTQIEVIDHALNYFKNTEFSHVILLQPSSPFRKKDEILKGIEMLKNGCNSVIGVCEPIMHPADYIYSKKGKLNWILDDFRGKNRQEFPKLFFNNGAFYGFEINFFKKYKILYNEKSKLLIMNRNSFVDIDDSFDYKLAKYIIENEKNI